MRHLLVNALWYGAWVIGAALFASLVIIFALVSPVFWLVRCLTAAEISPAFRDKDFGTGADWPNPLKILSYLREIRLPKPPAS